MRWLPLHRFCHMLVSGSNRLVSTPRVHLLPLLRQRQWPVVEQPWLERQLLVSFAQLADERQEPELQQRRSQPAEQQQSVQRLRSQGSAALIHNSMSRHDESPFLFPLILSMAEQYTNTDIPGYKLTRDQLLYDLYVSYYDAARHKHKMSYVIKFEANLAENLNKLCDDLLTRRYEAQPSKCFRGEISQEARGICCHVPRQNCSPSLLPIYSSIIRAHLYC